MAIAALVLWMCTAAAGAYLLATSMRTTDSDRAPETTEAGRVPQTAPAATASAQPQAAVKVRPRDRFDPPSLARAKSEPIPGMRALGEFAHPALAIIGLGFWLGYVLTHYRVFAAIGFGVLLGAICAGLSWFATNARAKRAGKDALSPAGRLLVLHAAGAALTLLIAALIVARA